MFQDPDDIYSQSYIPGTLTNHKIATLSTRDAVKDSRQQFLLNEKKKKGTRIKITFEIACEEEIIFFLIFMSLCVLPSIRVYDKQNKNRLFLLTYH